MWPHVRYNQLQLPITRLARLKPKLQTIETKGHRKEAQRKGFLLSPFLSPLSPCACVSVCGQQCKICPTFGVFFPFIAMCAPSFCAGLVFCHLTCPFSLSFVAHCEICQRLLQLSLLLFFLLLPPCGHCHIRFCCCPAAA